MVVGQDLASRSLDPGAVGCLEEPAEQDPAQPAPLVAVGDYQGELGVVGVA